MKQPDPHTYRPDPWLGVWRGWKVGSVVWGETKDPVFRVRDAWKLGCFRACAHPTMMTETKLVRRHHLDRQQTTPSGLPAIRSVQGPTFGLELEELLEAKLLCFCTIVFLNLQHVIDVFRPGGSSPRLGMAH